MKSICLTIVFGCLLTTCLTGAASAQTGQKTDETKKQSDTKKAAQPKLTETQKEMRKLGFRMTFFYRKPTATEFKELNALIDKHDDFILKTSKRNRFNIVAAAFLARVHQKHKFPMTAKGKIGNLAKAIIAGDKDNRDAAFVNDPKKITGSKLDVWWVSFSATGDTKYLESILQQTGNPKTKKINGLLDIPVVSAANWSFRSNCRVHKPVFDFASKAANEKKWAAQAVFLEHCVKFAAAKPKVDSKK